MAAETTWSELKQSGNDLFKDAQFLKAAAKYTAAIKIFDGESEELAVLHSNRCAALLKVSKVSKALGDADKCIALRPSWEKGYFRKGSALEALSDFEGALAVYREGSKVANSTDLGRRQEMMEAKVKKASRTSRASAKA